MTELGSFEPEQKDAKIEQQERFENDLEVDLGNAGIVYFAPVGGFALRNERQLARRDELTIPYPAAGINKGNEAEVAFQKTRGKGVNPLQSPNFEVKVHVLNMRKEGDALAFDTKPGTFVMGNDDKNVGLQKPENVALRAELGIPLATAAILFTTEKDGSSFMVVQHRGPGNASYKEMLGASVAGTNKHEVTREAKLTPLTDVSVKHFVATEMEEETGITPEDLVGGLETGIEVDGVGIDKRRVHLELLARAKVKLSAEEIQKRAESNLSVERGAFNFAENVFVLPGTPEAIAKILTLETPIPPTHAAAFLAAGRALVLEQQGAEAAAAWTKELQEKIKQTNERIDEIVRTFTQGREKGYNPRLAPAEQGLKTAGEALQEAGLLRVQG